MRNNKFTIADFTKIVVGCNIFIKYLLRWISKAKICSSCVYYACDEPDEGKCFFNTKPEDYSSGGCYDCSYRKGEQFNNKHEKVTFCNKYCPEVKPFNYCKNWRKEWD